MSSDEDDTARPPRQRRRSQPGGMSVISEARGSLLGRRQTSTVHEERSVDQDWQHAQVLRPAGSSTAKKLSSLPMPLSRSGMFRDLAATRRASAAAAVQREDTDTEDELRALRAAAGKPKPPPTPSVLQQRLSARATSAAVNAGPSAPPASNSAAAESDSDDEMWVRTRGSITASGLRSVRGSLSSSRPAAASGPFQESKPAEGALS